MTPRISRARPRLVAFDLDGTLVDSIEDIARSVNEALVERYGASGALPVDSVRGFVGGGARQLIERCLALLEKPPGDLTPAFERFLSLYRSRLVEATILYPGMREVLGEIGKHAKLAVLTNKPGEMSRAIVRELGLDRCFIEVIGGDDLPTRKPDPEGLLKLAGLAQVRPDETALVGDSAVDVLTARNAGGLAIGVSWGYDRAGMERERPDLCAQDPAHLARLLIGEFLEGSAFS